MGRRDTVSGAYTIDEGDNLLPQADPFSGRREWAARWLVCRRRIFFRPCFEYSYVGFSRAAFADNSSHSAAFLAQQIA